MTVILNLSLGKPTVKPDRMEFYNFKEKGCQQTFKELTENKSDFINCFLNKKSFEEQIEQWKQLLWKCINQSFKKYRVRKRNIRITKAAQRINVRNMKKCKGENTESIDREIGNIISEEFILKFRKQFKRINENPENIDRIGMWKLIDEIKSANKQTPQTIKINHVGRKVSDMDQIKSLLLKEYTDRLRERPL